MGTLLDSEIDELTERLERLLDMKRAEEAKWPKRCVLYADFNTAVMRAAGEALGLSGPGVGMFMLESIDALRIEYSVNARGVKTLLTVNGRTLEGKNG